MRAYDGGDGAMMRPLLVFLLAKDVFSYISYYKSHIYGFKGCCQCNATWQGGRRQRKKTHHDKIPLSSSPIACPLPAHCSGLAAVIPRHSPKPRAPCGTLTYILSLRDFSPEYVTPSERQAGGSPEKPPRGPLPAVSLLFSLWTKHRKTRSLTGALPSLEPES